MKNASLFLSTFLLVQSLPAQYVEPNYLFISGNANLKASADSYMLIFSLEEYFDDCETGERKLMGLDQLFTQLKDKLIEYGLPKATPTLLNVSSVNSSYGNTPKIFLRKSYGFSDSTSNYTLLLKVVENLRFKGLVGINVRAEYSDRAQDQMDACSAAMDDANLKSDLIFEKLHLDKGQIQQVTINATDYDNYRNNNYDYINQSIYGQFAFSMLPSQVQCGVSVRYEIVNK